MCGRGVIRLSVCVCTKICVCMGVVFLPITDIGFLAKRSRPQMPTYLLRQPADQRRTKYSTPKNTTRTISCQTNEGAREVDIKKQKKNIRCDCRMLTVMPEQLLRLKQSLCYFNHNNIDGILLITE